MFSTHKCNSKPKEAILRGVYTDNLTMAGKGTEEARPRGGWPRRRKLPWIFPVVLAVALCFVPDRGPSLSDHGEFPVLALHSPSFVPDGLDSSSEGIREDLPILSERDWADLVSQGQRLESTDLDSRFHMDYTLLISQDDHVRLASLFGLDVKTIVIDPGHGGADPGVVGARGTKEKDITLDVALRLKERLSGIGHYRVLLTRDRDKTLSLAKRVEFAKANQADLFISVHVNSLPNQSVNVIETYYFGPPPNAEILRLAEQENRESHFTIGELNTIIKDIGNTVKRQESIRLASSIQKCLFKNVRHYDAQVLDVGVKMAPFVVLSRIDVPSVLVEISCLTKEEEEVKLASVEYREKVASFLEEGIVEYLGR
jgi:N-acetylmuramoyl-L-alanine amidase